MGHVLGRELSGDPLRLVPVPRTGRENHDLHETLEEVHEVLFFLMVAVAVVHIFAALYHHFLLKDGVLRRMLPFSRP